MKGKLLRVMQVIALTLGFIALALLMYGIIKTFI